MIGAKILMSTIFLWVVFLLENKLLTVLDVLTGGGHL